MDRSQRAYISSTYERYAACVSLAAGAIFAATSAPRRGFRDVPPQNTVEDKILRRYKKNMPEDDQPSTLLLAEPPTGLSEIDVGAAETVTALPGSTPKPRVRTRSGLEIPARLGHFELHEVLGEGGMGAVFRAFDTSLHRDVAIKVLRAEVASEPALIARFQREARSQARLTHPHITTIYFVGEQDGFPYFAIELVPGGTLADTLRSDEVLAWEQALEYLIQIVSGLRHAHDKGIIHRDIKPANLLLDADGRVKIADFGLAKPIEEGGDVELTAAGSFMGTPQYVAPEQARGEQVDHRADIYSLGATFYHLLAKRPPFDAPTPVGVVMKHASEPLPDLRDFNAHVPPRFRDIIARMMAKSPADRFASYDELLEALEAARSKSAQPAGFLVRGVAMTIDVLPWLFLTQINDWLLLGFPIYLAIAHGLSGRSLGKMLFRLKVVDEHGERPSWPRALARAGIFAWVLFGVLAISGVSKVAFGTSQLGMHVKRDTIKVSAGSQDYEGDRDVANLQLASKEGEPVPQLAVVLIAFTAALFALWLAGLLIAGFDPQKRALHDRIAKTKVIYS